MLVTVEIYQPDGTTFIESFSDTIGNISDIEMLFSGLSFNINAMGGMGTCSIPLRKTETTISANVGDIVKILNDSIIIYVGQIIARNNDFSDERNYVDKVNLSATNPIERASGLHYTLKENNGTTISTTIQTVLTDLFNSGQFSGKNQDNVTEITNANATIITYSAGNNTLPALSIDTSYDGDNTVTAVREIIDMARGAVDLTSTEDYIYYMKSDFSWHTKTRENNTSPIGTFDIGNLPFFMDSSVDIDNYQVPVVEDNIINKVIINGVVITSNYYSSQIATSQSTYGIRELVINDSNIAMSQTSNWMDGWILKYLESTTTYNFTLKNEWFPTDPDGYIKITKDSGGSTIATVPFQSATYVLDSGGFEMDVVAGDIRPVIDEKRLIRRQTIAQQPAPDTTPPVVTALDNRPSSYEKTYTKTERDFYIGCLATDVNGITTGTIKAYLSKLTPPSTWGSYSLMGSLTFNAAPDSDSQDYYELSTGSGYYDLVTTGGLTEPSASGPGSIFKVKIIARDPSGNVGESVREFQLGEDSPDVNVSVFTPSTDVLAAPSVFDIASSDGFRLRIDTTTQAVDTVVVNYSNTNINVTLTSDATGLYYLTDDMAQPPKGKTYVAEITITNKDGKISTSLHYARGVDRQAMGPPVTVSDPSNVVDEESTSVQQYKDNVEFKVLFKKDDFTVADTDVKINIYSPPIGSLWPPLGTDSPVLEYTFTSATTPAVFETSSGSGIFKLVTDVTALGVLGITAGMYTVTSETRKNEIFKDAAGAEHDRFSEWTESDHSQFQIVTKTLGKDLVDANVVLTDHTSRLPDAEKKIVDVANKIEVVSDIFELTDGTLTAVKLGRELQDDTGNAHIYWDSGSDSYKVITTTGGTAQIAGGSNPTGTNYPTFEINEDDSSETLVYLILTANSGANKGALRYDYNGGIPTLKIATNYESGTPNWVDISTGTATKIENDYSAQNYELEVSSVDGSLNYTKDVGGTPITIFKIERTGAITVKDDSGNTILSASTTGVITTTNNIVPDTDSDSTIGDSTHKYAEIYGDDGYLETLTFSADGGVTENGRFEADATNDVVFPYTIAMGFMDG